MILHLVLSNQAEDSGRREAGKGFVTKDFFWSLESPCPQDIPCPHAFPIFPTSSNSAGSFHHPAAFLFLPPSTAPLVCSVTEHWRFAATHPKPYGLTFPRANQPEFKISPFFLTIFTPVTGRTSIIQNQMEQNTTLTMAFLMKPAEVYPPSLFSSGSGGKAFSCVQDLPCSIPGVVPMSHGGRVCVR